MENIIVLGLFLSLLLLGCNNKKSDNLNNMYSSYQKDMYKDTVHNLSDNVLEIFTKYKGEKHGVMHIVDSEFGIIEEQLYLNNKIMVVKGLGGDSLHVGVTYFYNLNDTLFPMGSILYNRNTQEKDQMACSYFELKASDTIEFGKPYEINIIGNIGIKENFNIALTLGEVDSAYNLLDTIETFISNNRKLTIEINEYQSGINLITGIINYYENGQDVTKDYRISNIDLPLIFYKQFYAISDSADANL
jgi:hypothetical protein